MKLKHRLGMIAIFVLAAWLLSGCIDLRIVTIVDSDGSGQWEVGLHLDEGLDAFTEESEEGEGGEAAEDDDIFSILRDGPQTDQESGITFSSEERITNGVRWLVAMAEIPDADAWAELEAALERLMPDDPEDAETEEIDLTGDLSEGLMFPVVTVDESLTGNTIRVEFNGPPPADLMAEDEEEEEEESSIELDWDPASAISFVHEIDLPGDLGEHNGTIDSATGNPVWIMDLNSTEPYHIEAESTTSNSTLLIGIVAAAFLIIGGGVGGYILLKRRASSPLPAEPV